MSASTNDVGYEAFKKRLNTKFQISKPEDFITKKNELVQYLQSLKQNLVLLNQELAHLSHYLTENALANPAQGAKYLEDSIITQCIRRADFLKIITEQGTHPAIQTYLASAPSQKRKKEAGATKTETASTSRAVINKKLAEKILSMEALFSASMNIFGGETRKNLEAWGKQEDADFTIVKKFSKSLLSKLKVKGNKEKGFSIRLIPKLEAQGIIKPNLIVKFMMTGKEREDLEKNPEKKDQLKILKEIEKRDQDYLADPSPENLRKIKEAYPKLSREWKEYVDEMNRYRESMKKYEKKMELFTAFEIAVRQLLMNENQEKLLEFLDKNIEISKFFEDNLHLLEGPAESFKVFSETHEAEQEEYRSSEVAGARGSTEPKKGKHTPPKVSTPAAPKASTAATTATTSTAASASTASTATTATTATATSTTASSTSTTSKTNDEDEISKAIANATTSGTKIPLILNTESREEVLLTPQKLKDSKELIAYELTRELRAFDQFFGNRKLADETDQEEKKIPSIVQKFKNGDETDKKIFSSLQILVRKQAWEETQGKLTQLSKSFAEQMKSKPERYPNPENRQLTTNEVDKLIERARIQFPYGQAYQNMKPQSLKSAFQEALTKLRQKYIQEVNARMEAEKIAEENRKAAGDLTRVIPRDTSANALNTVSPQSTTGSSKDNKQNPKK